MSEARLTLRQIILGYAEESGLTLSVKKLTPQFTNYMSELDIDLNCLKDARGHYSFSTNGAQFIKAFFNDYTSRESRAVRAKREPPSREKIQQWENFIRDTMESNGRDEASIQTQLNHLYRQAPLIKKGELNAIAGYCAKELFKLTKCMENEEFILPLDKKLLVEIMKVWVLHSIDNSVLFLKEMLSGFRDARQEELSNYGIESADNPELDSYNKASFAVEDLLTKDEFFNKKNIEWLELVKKGGATDQSGRLKIKTELEQKKRGFCQQISEEWNLDAETLWKHMQAGGLKPSSTILEEIFAEM